MLPPPSNPPDQTLWWAELQSANEKLRTSEELIAKLRREERDRELYVAWIEERLECAERQQRQSAAELAELDAAKGQMRRLRDAVQQKGIHISFLEERLEEEGKKVARLRADRSQWDDEKEDDLCDLPVQEREGVRARGAGPAEMATPTRDATLRYGRAAPPPTEPHGQTQRVSQKVYHALRTDYTQLRREFRRLQHHAENAKAALDTMADAPLAPVAGADFVLITPLDDHALR